MIRRIHDSPRFPRVGASGFTLIELICVLVIVAILAVSASTYYATLLDDSKKSGAKNIVAAAQTQLSLEFSRRAVAGLALDVDAQPICNWVIIDTSEVSASVGCSGNINGNVAITAGIEGQNVTGAWNSPLAGGS